MNLSLLRVAAGMVLMLSCQPNNPESGLSGGSEVKDEIGQPQLDVHWYRQPLRIVQIVLREPDAEDYDVGGLVNYLKKSAGNVLVINGGGIVDFFQNPLPASNINKFLGKRDLLKEIVEACHTENIKVIARVDFRGVEQHIYDQYPDWFARESDGTPKMLDYTKPRLFTACYNGYYRNEHAVQFIDHLMENYDVDGIWHNSIAVHGICYCGTCRKLYEEEAEEEIPIQGESSSADLRRYMQWKSRSADEHMSKMKQVVKAYGNDKVYTAEVFGMFETVPLIHSGIDLYNAKDHFDFLVSVAFLRPNREGFQYEDLGYAGSITKFLKALDPDKEAIILWGGNGTAHRYVMESPIDSRIWLYEALSSGGRFWNCNFTGQNPSSTYDRRNAYLTSDIYQFVETHQKILANQDPVAEIGIFYSNLARENYDIFREEGNPYGIPTKGIEQVLRENHHQYTFIPDKDLTQSALEKFKVVVLPNVALMSDSQVKLFNKYVENGGNLIATYETSLYNEEGEKKADFALSELFGCSYSGERVNTNKDCYQRISAVNGLTTGFEKTELIINAGNTLLCLPSSSGKTKVVCNYIPRVHNQPPEKAWIDGMESKYATMLLTEYGKGEVIYFANQPDRYAYLGGHDDFRNILRNSLEYLLGKPMLETNAPESVHVSLTKSSDSPIFILSLVNHTSAPIRPLRSIIPVHNITVDIDFKSSILDSYQVLKADGDVVINNREGIQVKLQMLDEYASIALVVKSPSK